MTVRSCGVAGDEAARTTDVPLATAVTCAVPAPVITGAPTLEPEFSVHASAGFAMTDPRLFLTVALTPRVAPIAVNVWVVFGSRSIVAAALDTVTSRESRTEL